MQIEKLIDQKIKGADSIGIEPKTQKKLYVLNGRYGAYVQMGENDDPEIKRSSLPPGLDPKDVNYDMALDIIAMPKTVGEHPELKKDVKVGVGRFGPYVFCNGDYRSIPKTETVFTMDLAKCLELLAQPKKGRGKAAPLKEFGKHPQHDVDVQLLNGPYGVYIKAGKTNVGLPEGMTADQLTAEKAFELINDKIGTTPLVEKKSKAKKAPARKSATPKAKVEKAEAKPAAKKVIVKKKK